MTEQKENNPEKKKGFFGKLLEKLDAKLEVKAKKTCCCCGPRKDPAEENKSPDGDSCCG